MYLPYSTGFLSEIMEIPIIINIIHVYISLKLQDYEFDIIHVMKFGMF